MSAHEPIPIPIPTESDKARFFEKVDVGEEDECWTWTAAKNNRGYGRIGFGTRMMYAHRISYRIHHGDPGDSPILHACDNPSCVNPRHISTGTYSQNVQDSYDRDRREPASLPGESNPQSKITENDVREIRSRYASGDVYQRELADKFGVSQRLVSMIVRGDRWGHVK